MSFWDIAQSIIFSNNYRATSYNPFAYTTTFSSYAPIFSSYSNPTNNFSSYNFFSNLFSTNRTFTPFNFSYSSKKSTPTAPTSNGVSVVGKNQNASLWEKLGYCASAGMKLANDVLKHATGFIKKCATYVKNAIARVGLGKYVSGHAYQMVSIMRNNKKFKEISPKGVNLKTLPAGCVLVYGKGVGGYSSTYGHTEITTGDGRAVSDGITRNLHKTPTAIFMPISA